MKCPRSTGPSLPSPPHRRMRPSALPEARHWPSRLQASDLTSAGPETDRPTLPSPPKHQASPLIPPISARRRPSGLQQTEQRDPAFSVQHRPLPAFLAPQPDVGIVVRGRRLTIGAPVQAASGTGLLEHGAGLAVALPDSDGAFIGPRGQAWLSGLQDNDQTPFAGSTGPAIPSPSHRRTVPSGLAEARRRPSGLRRTPPTTTDVCPFSERTGSPSGCQSRTRPLLPAEASQVPSRRPATELTISESPITGPGVPSGSQIRTTVLSWLADASRPDRVQERSTTGALCPWRKHTGAASRLIDPGSGHPTCPWPASGHRN